MKRKLALDVILLVLFGLLCNTAVTGTQMHELGGLLYAALIGLHLLLNKKWLSAAFRGKLHGRRAAMTAAVNVALSVDLLVILASGLRCSHYLFPAAVKAPTAMMLLHIIGGIVAALLVLTHVVLHEKVVTKKKRLPQVGLAAVLTLVIGYSLFGGIQGALHHGLPKDGAEKGQYEDHVGDENDHTGKAGENKGERRTP